MSVHCLSKFFDSCTEALQAGRPSEAMQLLRAVEAESLPPSSAALLGLLRSKAHKALEAIEPPRPSRFTLLQAEQEATSPGVTLVGACMNRQGNLLKVLPSWLASGADEIVIVDWSSTQPLWPMLAHIDDPRLKVVRIEDEPRWILTHAFNVGLRLARRELVFKLDADIELAPGFLKLNRFKPGEFVRGFWKSAVDAGEPDQRYTNGSFGAFKADLRAIGYYNERIQTYGWDDSDLYARLSGSLGRAGRLLAHGSLCHLHQEEAQRLENQSISQAHVLGRFAPTEHENLVNKFHELTCLEWASYMPAQDYEFVTDSPRLISGRRSTTPVTHVPEERDLAKVLAMRQLATWRGDLLPSSAWSVSCSIEFARLLKQAQEVGLADRLVEALRERRGLHLVNAESGALCKAAERTLGIICGHYPQGQVLVIVADDGYRPGEAAGSAPQVLHASEALVKVLAEVLDAQPREDLQSLEDTLAAGPGAACTQWNVSVAAVAAAGIAHARTIARNLDGRLRISIQVAPRTAFATSVYDETNLLRLLEYLACIVLNLDVVERLLLMYEARNGLFQLVAQAMCRQLGVAPTRLSLLPFDRRPNFQELFSLQSLLPDGTLLAVGNADVALDATLADLAAAARDDHVYVLSRWDIDETGRKAHLIRLECGIPNVFSADAWITRTPFQPDFWLDYGIGTFHCDSFINHQLSRSKRYRWANPCLDVHVFHLHDARFNSSAEKHVRERAEIERRYGEERKRNGGEEPIKGAPWTSLAHAGLWGEGDFLVNWRAKALVLDMTRQGASLASLLWLHLVRPHVGDADYIALVVRLRAADSAGPFGRLLALYKRQFRVRGMFIEIDDADFDPSKAPQPAVLCRDANARDLLDLMQSDSAAAWARQIEALMAWAPEGSGVMQTRCTLVSDLDSADTRRLVGCLRERQPESFSALMDFLQSLNRWSEEGCLVLPFLADLRQAQPSSAALVGLNQPAISLVTSLYRGNEFLEGFLENAADAAIVANGEVVVVDANCDGHDTEGIERFFQARPELRRFFDIVRLDKDPGLYACWQLAIERSRGEFISNANLDDRRSPQHTLQLVQALQARPQLAGAAGSISAVFQHAPGSWFGMLPNQVWFENLGQREFGFEDLYARNDDGSVRSHNIMHCMPVWRRSLHERYGFFDEERYGTSADWAFWLKCARQGERFWLEPTAFGRYFVNPDSHNRRNDAQGMKERRIIADLLGIEQELVIKQ